MSFVLHVGFHKTASTSLYMNVARQSSWLTEREIAIVNRAPFRKAVIDPLHKMASSPQDAPHALQLRRQVRDHLEVMFARPNKRLILSEPEVTGPLDPVTYMGNLYRAPQRHIAALASALPHAPSRILISVRDYRTFFAACYLDHLDRVTPGRFQWPEVMAAKVMGNIPSWTRLVEEYQRAFPRAEIFIWRYEDFDSVYDRVLTALLGRRHGADFAKTFAAQRAHVETGPTPGAWLRLVEHCKANGLAPALQAWPELRAEQEGDWEVSLFPWTAQQSAHLERTYARDWEAIQQLPSIRVLRG